MTAPSGLITQTTTDVLGRTLTVTDNVSGQKLGSNPKARTVQTNQYSPDGSQLTTVTPDGTTATAFDALGRVVSIVHPGGITQTDKYNDVANTQTVSLLASGSTTAHLDQHRRLQRPQPGDVLVHQLPRRDRSDQASQHYDGIGRATDYSTDGLTATTSYAGAGGLQTGTTLTPTDPTDFPGSAVSDSTANTMTGALTTKSLTSQATNQDATAPATGTSYTYNAAGQIETATDPAGHVTSYTYTPAGQIATATQADKAVTTYTYDKTGQLTRRTSRVPTAPPKTPVTPITRPPGRSSRYTTRTIPTTRSPTTTMPTATWSPSTTPTASPPMPPTPTLGDWPPSPTPPAPSPPITTTTTATAGRPPPTCAPPSRSAAGTPWPACPTSTTRWTGWTVNRGNKVSTAVTYTDANQVATETTTGADGSTLRSTSTPTTRTAMSPRTPSPGPCPPRPLPARPPAR